MTGLTLHVWQVLMGVLMAFLLGSPVQAQTACLTRTQVSSGCGSQNTCYYIHGQKVYAIGSCGSPHKGHPCGSDITSVLPSFHLGWGPFNSSYRTDLCPAATPTSVPASPDLDGNGKVDLFDYSRLSRFIGQAVAAADLRRDGVIDWLDFRVLIGWVR